MSLDDTYKRYREMHGVCDQTPSPAEFIERIKLLVEEDPRFIQAFHAAIGLAGESGELLELFKKRIFSPDPYKGKKEFSAGAVTKEMGDAGFYLEMGCKSRNITLEDLLAENDDKLRARFPKKFELKGYEGPWIAPRVDDKESIEEILRYNDEN